MARGVVEGCSHGATEMSIISVERRMKGRERGDTLQSRYYRNASKPLREAGQEPAEGRKSDFDKDAK